MSWVPWQVGVAANGVLALTYGLIALGLLVPLARTRQLRANLLATATGAIFVSCAVHHLVLAATLATFRYAWGWPLVACDVVGVIVAACYWAERRSAGATGVRLFADRREQEQQALELNDTVLQGLAVAQMSLSLGQTERAADVIDDTMASLSRIVTELLGDERLDLDLVRAAPATPGGHVSADDAARARGRRDAL